MSGFSGKGPLKKDSLPHITHASLSKIIRTHEKRYTGKGRLDSVNMQNGVQLKEDDARARF